jgi:hypothetical protein
MLLEHPAEVEADDRLVFGDQHAQRTATRGLAEIVEHRHRAPPFVPDQQKSPQESETPEGSSAFGDRIRAAHLHTP